MPEQNRGGAIQLRPTREKVVEHSLRRIAEESGKDTMGDVGSEPVGITSKSLNGLPSGSDDTESQILAPECMRASQSVCSTGCLGHIIATADCRAALTVELPSAGSFERIAKMLYLWLTSLIRPQD